MVKANELIKLQKERESKKYIIFDKIYDRIEKKICIASSNNYYYTWYIIPEFLVGLPIYSLNDCNKYILDKLKDNGFNVNSYDNKLLLIKWSI